MKNTREIYRVSYDYLIDLTAPRNDNIVESQLQALTAEQYHNATCEETRKFFNNLGKTTFKYLGGYCWEWRSKSPDGTMQRVTRYYNNIDQLIKREGFSTEDLTPNEHQTQKSFYNKAQIIRNKKGLELGLKSYNSLVCIFKGGEGVEIVDNYSLTTNKHINAYMFRKYLHYASEEIETTRRITSKQIKKSRFYYFKQYA